IPLALLYLHKFFEDERPSSLFFFTLFYVLQVLANGYYGLFLTLYCGLLVLGMGWARGWLAAPRFWARWAVAGVVVVLLVGPFYYQYLVLRHEMGFVRTGYSYARLWSYLGAPSANVLYGDLLGAFDSPGSALFPGLTVLALAFFGLAEHWRGGRGPAWRGELLVRRVLGIVIVVDAIVIAYVALVAPIRCSILGVEITVSGTRKAEIVLLYTLLAGLVLHCGPAAIARWLSGMPERQRIYLGIAVLSVLFTFGPVGPYAFLYAFVPGFDGLRAASRFGVFVMLSLAVLAAYGLARLLRETTGRARVIAALLPPLLVCGEFLSVPMPMVEVPVKQAVPRVYRWLAEQEGDGPVVELPISRARERLRVYYSIYHWKKLVNGVSSYFPELYLEFEKRSRGFPSAQVVSDLEDLGVRYAVVDVDALEAESPGAQARLAALGERLRLVASFDRTRVYELLGRKEVLEPVSARRFESLDRRGWSVQAHPNARRAQRAIDGDPSSWWRVEPNAAEAFFQVDLAAEQWLAGVILKAARPREYPLGFRIEVSRDGTSWQRVAQDDAFRPPILGYLRPLEFRVALEFEAVLARQLRVLRTAGAETRHWSIAEIELIPAAPPP
ncbi:MAG: discoidin domain-containing protein, partial [Deltaproteobacteria bacterium]|nr:discoidin domain-containing protein [Deltaproteobacteria bacterium]